MLDEKKGNLNNISSDTENLLDLNLRSALFWDFTHCKMLVWYGRFGTTYRSDLWRSSTILGELDRWRQDQ